MVFYFLCTAAILIGIFIIGYITTHLVFFEEANFVNRFPEDVLVCFDVGNLKELNKSELLRSQNTPRHFTSLTASD